MHAVQGDLKIKSQSLPGGGRLEGGTAPVQKTETLSCRLGLHWVELRPVRGLAREGKPAGPQAQSPVAQWQPKAPLIKLAVP